MVEDIVKLETKTSKATTRIVILALLAGITLIFLTLYHKFIFSDYWYAYLDVGRDTVDQYIPREIYEIRNFLNGDVNTYTLTFGLGSNYVFPWYKYFNPVNWPLILMGSYNLRLAISLSIYLKYLFIGVFAWLFFRRIFRDERVAVISSIIWTYSGYNVLWGQHYGFLTSMMTFTIFMWGLQLILDGDRRWYIAPLAFFALATTAYTFFYQALIFAVIYSAAYFIINREKGKTIYKKIGCFFLGIVVSLGLSAEYIAVSSESFLASSRMENVVSVSLGGVYPIKYIVSIFARFFSNDMLGVGSRSHYQGNYYEIASIAVGALFVLGFFWLVQSHYRKRVLVITGVSLLCLCLPVISHMLLFKATTQRWTFIICLLEIILIGYALKNINNEMQSENREVFCKKALRTFIFSDAFLAVSIAILLVLKKSFGVSVNKWTLTIVVCSYIMYHVAAFIIYLATTKTAIKPSIVFGTIVLPCCIVDLIVMNYRCVNSRSIVSADAWDNSIYNDGTSEIVEEIQSADDSLYRINKTYLSKYYNDQMVQNYYGVGSYYSLNSQNLIDAYSALGNEVYENTDTLTGTNYILFPETDIIDNTLLSVKYVVSDGEELDADFYEKVLETADKTLYKNKLWHGFGTVYTQVVDSESFMGLGPDQRRSVVSQAAVIKSGDLKSVAVEDKAIGDIKDTLDDAGVLSALQDLNSNGQVDLKEGHNVFYGTASNNSGMSGMLCVPLIYEEHWSALVDGAEAKVYKVNGGLIGIALEPGEHSLEITYKNNTAIIGRVVGIIVAVLYLSALVVIIKRDKGKA